MPQEPRTHSTSHGAIARTLAQAINSYGVDSDAIFKQHGIDLNEISEVNARVLDLDMIGVWADAVAATGDDALGITFANHFRIGSLHGLGFSWVSSDSLLDAFHRLARFFRVITSAGEVILQQGDDEVALWLRLTVPRNVAIDESIDAMMALFLQLCRFAKEDDFRPKRILLKRAIPSNRKRFEHYFNCPIEFNADQDKLIFSRQELETSLPVSNLELARANDEVVQNYLKRFNDENFATLVNLKIVESLPSGVPSQKRIAKNMHMSTRTLQRKLTQEGTSFSKLVDESRIALAKIYLTQPWRRISEVSYLLGYTEPSNFTRSFKRAIGLTPKKYRENWLKQ